MYPRAPARPVHSAAPVDAPFDGGLGVTGSVDALLDSMGHSADGEHTYNRLQTHGFVLRCDAHTDRYVVRIQAKRCPEPPLSTPTSSKLSAPMD